MILQVKEALLQKCLEVEKTAKEQAADNAILDRVSKVNILISGILGSTINPFFCGAGKSNLHQYVHGDVYGITSVQHNFVITN